MGITKTEIDNFYEFAVAEADNGSVPASLEECLLRWRRTRAKRAVSFAPFPDGKSLLDLLEEDGVVGLATDGPDDVATNPKYMEGFGRSSLGEEG